uniref:Uncharacterized protein n=1 Tax=Pyxicephalus adspersus TaxID=30357 RepID=A0AAV3B415_PYXAD|nr:TPA: hypothetical protein GDO54_007617 [Pyxicephalus adspersus]
MAMTPTGPATVPGAVWRNDRGKQRRRGRTAIVIWTACSLCDQILLSFFCKLLHPAEPPLATTNHQEHFTCIPSCSQASSWKVFPWTSVVLRQSIHYILDT